MSPDNVRRPLLVASGLSHLIMPELANEEKIKKTLEDFDWSVLFSDTPKTSIITTFLPWFSLILDIVIIILLWKK